MEKAQARKAALAKRARIANAQINDWSEKICELFTAHYADHESFLLYHSFGSEVQTHRLIDNLYRMNKTVYLPKVNGDRLELGLYKGESSLSGGAFGIQEPVECADYEHIDIAVIPGVGFDRRLYRIGYGKGYYDRLLGAVRPGLTVGFAFECQLFDAFDFEPHDIPADVLVTEKHIYRRNS